MLANILSISLGAILINNFIFSQFLGCCPFLGCSNKVDTAAGMGLAVVFVMGLASAICWVIDNYILIPLNLAFLETLAFILVIAALVQFVEMFLKKSVPSLYSALAPSRVVILPGIKTQTRVASPETIHMTIISRVKTLLVLLIIFLPRYLPHNI